METITSRQNPLMTHIRKLAGSAAYRRQTGECLCDSPKLLREAAQWGADVRTVVSVLPWDGPLPDHVRQVLVPPEVMSSISPAKTPQGCCSPAPFLFCRCRKRFRAGDMWCWTGSRTPVTWERCCGPWTPLTPTACC